MRAGQDATLLVMETDERFSDIEQVEEILNVSMVNKRLAEGWRLLKVLTKHDEHDYAAYVVGRPKKDAALPTSKELYSA